MSLEAFRGCKEMMANMRRAPFSSLSHTVACNWLSSNCGKFFVVVIISICMHMHMAIVGTKGDTIVGTKSRTKALLAPWLR